MKPRISLRWFMLVCVFCGLLVAILASKLRPRRSRHVPDDILRKVTEQYGYFKEGDLAQELVEKVMQRSLNVGEAQFCRAILILSNGDLEELKVLSNIPEDPRDTLVKANGATNGKYGYFFEPFPRD